MGKGQEVEAMDGWALPAHSWCEDKQTDVHTDGYDNRCDTPMGQKKSAVSLIPQ